MVETSKKSRFAAMAADLAASWARYAGWSLLAVITALVAAAPDLLRPAAPRGATILARASYQAGGAETEVSLPHAVYPRLNGQPLTTTYRFEFGLNAVPKDGLFLLIPLLNRQFSLILNDEKLLEGGSRALWRGPLVSSADLVQLPRPTLNGGRNRLTIVVDAGLSMVPTYLSPIYLGTEAMLSPPFKWWFFLDQQLNYMGFGAHILLGLGLIFVFFIRRQDPMFSWLAAMEALTLTVTFGNFVGFHPSLQGALPFFIALIPAAALVNIGVALSVLHMRPPRALAATIFAATAICLICAIVDSGVSRMISAAGAVVFVTVSGIAGACIYAWGAVARRDPDARLMLAPAVVFAWFLCRDAYVAATLPAHPFNLLTSMGRLLYLAAVTAVLMRRMGASLDQLDRSNETLGLKLAEREAELAILHRHERAETATTVREQERQRLTHDLHDGLSGHLVSIIALSERSGEKPTEQAAREALNDLRLVIYSLDLGEHELPLALANFRERLIPQFRRLGIALDWSIASLPEVSGVTPGNALAVLRILQEAITNALKHGPARRIVIRASPSADNGAAIVVENDGQCFVENRSGHGLGNMRRRAGQLGGKLSVEALAHGTRLSLVLPLRLPAFDDENVA